MSGAVHVASSNAGENEEFPAPFGRNVSAAEPCPEDGTANSIHRRYEG